MDSKINSKKIVLTGLLIALQIVLSRFLSVNTTFLQIGFGFLPLAVCSIMMGPVWGAAAGVIADIIGANLFPSGPFFPGFTLNAALGGLSYGLFTYKKKPGFMNVAIPVTLNCLIINIVLGTLWLSMLYGKGYLAILPPRIIKNLTAIPIQTFMILFVWKRVVMPYKAGRFGHDF